MFVITAMTLTYIWQLLQACSTVIKIRPNAGQWVIALFAAEYDEKMLWRPKVSTHKQRAVKRVCVCDVERVCAVVRHVSESERDSVADVASAAGDGGYDVQLNIASTSTRTVSDNYVSPADIAYTATYQCICWIFAEVFRVRPQSIVIQQWFAASAVVHITVVTCFRTSRFKIPPVACWHYDMCMISDMLHAYSAAVVVAAVTVTIAAS